MEKKLFYPDWKEEELLNLCCSKTTETGILFDMALSKTQNKRLGALLSVMFNDSIPSDLCNDLVVEGYLAVDGNDFKLTEKGLDEKNRLCTLAGLNIKYQSEDKKEKSNGTG